MTFESIIYLLKKRFMHYIDISFKNQYVIKIHGNNCIRGKDLKHISEILSAALSKHRPAQDTAMTQIWDIWDEAVGKDIALNAKPGAFKDGILMVNVSSSAWMHQLRFLEADIIQNINQRLGRAMVQTIRFKIGKILG